jgi:Fur family ferric uptake transcriptional regulator
MSKDDLQEAGLRATQPRMLVLEVLRRSHSKHLSAEEIYRELLAAGEAVGVATVYRVLTQFEAAGLVHRHHFDGTHAVFELAAETHHDHIICTTCSEIIEFYDDTIEKRQGEVAGQKGFAIRDHSLVIFGDCLDPDCPRRGKSGRI